MESEHPKAPSKSDNVYTSTRSTNKAAIDEKHGTQNDGLDMDRMGKLQQLRVRSWVPSQCAIMLTINRSARLQVHVDIWLRGYTGQHMGIRSSVRLYPSSAAPNQRMLTYRFFVLQYHGNFFKQWRHSWWHLDVFGRLFRHVLRDAFHGRNGVDVSIASAKIF
jgi:hypothetical protein